MNNRKYLNYLTAVVVSLGTILSSVAQEQSAPKQEQKPPSEAEMMAMMTELAKPGENHKLLATGVGTWTYVSKWWMDPSAAPSESTGVAVTREVMGGRYFISEHTGKMQMSGPDGKMTEMEFKGMSTEGYDNAKKKFVSSWIDNMGTGIILSEGSYDEATKSLTYRAEYEMMPGTKTKIREVIKIADRNHRSMEFFEDRGGTEVKTMEITYSRKG